jgi:2-polyprenyl-3-methyl-5-hydroxy-6-metoxy-1,4-benzoquinol methylase/uncharacterized protein YbaR (Trm112 family)
MTRSDLRLEIVNKGKKKFDGVEEEFIEEGVLYADELWVYPIIKGIPRLTVEALFEYDTFLQQHVNNFAHRRAQLLSAYKSLILQAEAKNRRTTKSFAKEWSFFNYEEDKTWGANRAEMFTRFLDESDETEASLKGKWIFNAGCGNGLSDIILAKKGINIIAMDLGKSIERAFAYNDSKNICFVQGDVQMPPVAFQAFDIVVSSGVLHHTNNTELSFSCITPMVKDGGKVSIWLYTPRPALVDKILHYIRRFTSKLPLNLQYLFYAIFIFPFSYIGNKLRGNKLNAREQMINIYDSLSCEYCWLHQPEEVAQWYTKRLFADTKVTTTDRWGFNIIGVKQPQK